MRRRFATLTLLTAWFFATGSEWDFVQVFAWTRMFAGYVQTMSVQEAITETFDADKPCELCCAVRRAKEQEKKEVPADGRAKGKIILICQPATRFLAAAPMVRPWFAPASESMGIDRARPALPPPRV